ncbi:MAG TPA: DUF2894 domain-containing protein [Trinickia sp.]
MVDGGDYDHGDVRRNTGVRATLEAWRACGADRVSPARFRFIDALERRAAGHDGDVRQLLDERLAVWVADYSREIERVEAEAAGTRASDGKSIATTASSPVQSAPRRGALGELADVLSRRAAAPTNPDGSAAPKGFHPHRHERSPDLPMLDYFRETWSKVSTEKQLRRSLEQVPDNAGPLNSNSLVHRSLSLMREASPGYLQHFLAYVEALSWMEQLAGPVAGAAAPPAADAPRSTAAKKSVRRKTR